MSEQVSHDYTPAGERLEHFNDLVAEFDTTMLVTQTPQGELRARPMNLAHRDSDNTLYFVTNDEKIGKVNELLANPLVNITMQGEDKYLSISGQAELIDDRAKIHDIWQSAWKVWFPEGKDDPTLRLIKFTPSTGEYWDITGTKKLGLLLEAGKAWIMGERLDPSSVGDHAKIGLKA